MYLLQEWDHDVHLFSRVHHDKQGPKMDRNRNRVDRYQRNSKLQINVRLIHTWDWKWS